MKYGPLSYYNLGRVFPRTARREPFNRRRHKSNFILFLSSPTQNILVDSLYSAARQGFLEGSIAWLTDTIKIAMVRSTYSPVLTGTTYYSDISTYVIGTPVTLSAKTSTNGTASCSSPISIGTLSNGETLKYYVIYKDTGIASGSPLIALLTGKILITAVVAANVSSTQVLIKPLKADLPINTALSFSGGATATLAQAHSIGDRVLYISSLSNNVAAGEVSEGAYVSNLPLAGAGSDISHAINNGLFQL